MCRLPLNWHLSSRCVQNTLKLSHEWCLSAVCGHVATQQGLSCRNKSLQDRGTGPCSLQIHSSLNACTAAQRKLAKLFRNGVMSSMLARQPDPTPSLVITAALSSECSTLLILLPCLCFSLLTGLAHGCMSMMCKQWCMSMMCRQLCMSMMCKLC